MAVVEAQRLIALSLGKISQSRIQRGGINLHKNLLVASVLYKARTAFIMENSRSRSDSESSEDECPGWESDNTSETSTSGNDYQSKKEMDSSSPSSPEPVESDDCFESEDKENSPPSENHSESDQDTDENAENMATDKQTNCQRCQKRRIADVDSEEYTAHDSAGDSVASSKKPRLELSESQKDNKYNSCEAEQSSPPEAMQISTLVNSFNSGFTGLLNTDSTDSLSCSPKDVYESSGVQGQGHTATDSLISCSTQIKEAFETLARPILALTV